MLENARVETASFHIGASILVFMPAGTKSASGCILWQSFSITGMDFIAALNIFNVISLSAWALEGIAAVFGLLTFFGAYLLLYKKDIEERP